MDYSQDTNQNKTNHKRSKKRKKKNSVGVAILRIIIIVVLVGGFALAGGLLGAYVGIIGSAPTLNTTDVVPESYTSIIYDSSGNEIDMLHGDENREYVKLESIPKYLQLAVVSIEDERFFDHNGIDVRGILRALIVNLKERDFSQGASTITQQLIKNEVLTKEKKLKRKIQEQYLAVKFEKDLKEKLGSKEKSKKYILELYLNSIGLNHGLNGVEAASKFYYGKSVNELTLAESASIAGITKNPSAYSPVSHPDNNKQRQITVLGKMLELGYITQAEYNQAKDEDIYSKIVGSTNDDNSSSKIHSYFVEALMSDIATDLMKQKNMNKQQAYNMIYSGGLQIYSTVDMHVQDIMEDSYKNDSLFPPSGNTLDVTYTISIMDKATEEQTHHTKTKTVKTEKEATEFVQSVKNELLNNTNEMVIDNIQISESLQSAMVVMDQHTGEVKGLIGGRGKKTGNRVFNMATQALRQPGSCFKIPAAYAPAIDLGIIAPGTVIMDDPFTYNGWSPKNWYKGYRGPCTVREGIRDSLNILAAKTIINVGVDKAYEYLLNFGFTSLVDSREINGKIYSDKSPATSLGGITDGVSVLELTAAYGAIANGGIYNKPTFYTKVVDHNGNILLEHKDNSNRVLKETTAYMLTNMMQDVITGGGTGGLARFKKVKMPIAGKTGTTSDDKDLMFAGYTPYYVAGIWLGYADPPRPIKYDRSYHLLLWSDIMEKIHQGLDYKKFEQPVGIVTKSFCSVSGGVPVAGLCENDYYGGGVRSDICAADFGSGKPCSYHKTFKIDLETGMLANEFCPADKVKEVVLSIDPETGEITNMPSEIPEGKVKINIHETCTVHNAETAASKNEKDENEGVIGDDTTVPDVNITDTNNPGGTSTSGTSTNHPSTPSNEDVDGEPDFPPPIGSLDPVTPPPVDDEDQLFIPE